MKGLSVCIAILISAFQINPFRQRTRTSKIIQESSYDVLLVAVV